MCAVVICVGVMETKTPDVEATRIWMVHTHGTFQEVGSQVLDRCGFTAEPASSFRSVPFPAVFPHFYCWESKISSPGSSAVVRLLLEEQE